MNIYQVNLSNNMVDEIEAEDIRDLLNKAYRLYNSSDILYIKKCQSKWRHFYREQVIPKKNGNKIWT